VGGGVLGVDLGAHRAGAVEDIGVVAQRCDAVEREQPRCERVGVLDLGGQGGPVAGGGGGRLDPHRALALLALLAALGAPGEGQVGVRAGDQPEHQALEAPGRGMVRGDVGEVGGRGGAGEHVEAPGGLVLEVDVQPGQRAAVGVEHQQRVLGRPRPLGLLLLERLVPGLLGRGVVQGGRLLVLAQLVADRPHRPVPARRWLLAVDDGEGPGRLLVGLLRAGAGHGVLLGAGAEPQQGQGRARGTGHQGAPSDGPARRGRCGRGVRHGLTLGIRQPGRPAPSAAACPAGRWGGQGGRPSLTSRGRSRPAAGSRADRPAGTRSARPPRGRARRRGPGSRPGGAGRPRSGSWS
jgi:hypothetical protein